MNRYWGGILTVTGFVACPCHLPLTLPIVLGILGGTGLGAFIGANTSLIYGLFTAYFVVGIGAGMYLWSRKRSETEGAVCELPPASADGQGGGRGKQTRAEKRRRARV